MAANYAKFEWGERFEAVFQQVPLVHIFWTLDSNVVNINIQSSVEKNNKYFLIYRFQKLHLYENLQTSDQFLV